MERQLCLGLGFQHGADLGQAQNHTDYGNNTGTRQLSLTELTAAVSSKICVLSLMTALCTPRFMAASFCQRWLWMKKPILYYRFRKLPQTVAGQDLCISLLTIIGYHGFTKGAGCFGFFSLNM